MPLHDRPGCCIGNASLLSDASRQCFERLMDAQARYAAMLRQGLKPEIDQAATEAANQPVTFGGHSGPTWPLSEKDQTASPEALPCS